MAENVDVAHTYAAPGTYTVTVVGADGGSATVVVTVSLPSPTNLRLRGQVAPQRVDLVWDYPDLAFTYKQSTTAGVVDNPRAWTQIWQPDKIAVDRAVVLVGDASTRFTVPSGRVDSPGYQWDNYASGQSVPFPIWGRVYVRIDAPVTTQTYVAWTMAASPKALRIGLDPSGKLIVQADDKQPVLTDISPQLGRWIRLEFGVAVAGDNLVEIRICDGEDPHAAANKLWSGDVGSSVAHPWNRFNFGVLANSAPTADVVLWQDLWEISSLGWVGPYAITRRARTVRAVAGPINFRIYRAGTADVTQFELIGTVTDPWVRTYTDTTLTPGGPYVYRVSAVQDGSESPASNEVSVDTTLPAPVLRQWRPSKTATNYLAWDTPSFEWRWYNNAARSLPGRRAWDQTDQLGGATVADDDAVSLVGGVSTRYALPDAAPVTSAARTWWKTQAEAAPKPPYCFRFYGRMDDLPPVEPEIIFGLEGAEAGTNQVQVQIDKAGLLWVLATGGSWTQSTLTVPTGSWWRLEIGVAQDGPQQVTLRLTEGADPHAQTFTQSQVDVGIDLTQLTQRAAWFGIVPKAAGSWAMNQDLWAGSTAGWVGPYPEHEKSGSSGTIPSGYVLQRKIAPAEFTHLADVTDPWQPTYVDNPVVAGTTYTYRVATKYGGSDSVWSNEVDILAAGTAPQVSTVSPNVGLMDGGTQVRITGQSFIGATGVSFGGKAGTGLSVLSDTELLITAPAGAGPVAVDVVVSTGAGTGTKTKGYAYQVKDLAQLATLGETLQDLSTVAPDLEGLHEGTPQE